MSGAGTISSRDVRTLSGRKEIAAYLGIHPSTVDRYILAGMPVTQIKRCAKILIRSDLLDIWMKKFEVMTDSDK